MLAHKSHIFLPIVAGQEVITLTGMITNLTFVEYLFRLRQLIVMYQTGQTHLLIESRCGSCG